MIGQIYMPPPEFRYSSQTSFVLLTIIPTARNDRVNVSLRITVYSVGKIKITVIYKHVWQKLTLKVCYDNCKHFKHRSLK